MRLLAIFLIGWSITLVSCETIEKYDNLIAPLSEEKFIEVMADVMVVESLPLTTIKSKTEKDSILSEKTHEVLAFHNVTKEDYIESTNVYFKMHTKTQGMMEKLLEVIQKKETDYLVYRSDTLRVLRDTSVREGRDSVKIK